jgi:hypothetical protein
MMPRRFTVTKEELHRLYWGEFLNSREIAEKFGVHLQTVCTRMKEFGIPVRPKHGPDLPETLLRTLYLDEKKSVARISVITGATFTHIYRLMERYSIPARSRLESAPKGFNHPHWQGRGWLNLSGYRVITKPSGGQIYEHRDVMQKHLGRSLSKDEHVHHINGDKSDNSIENLQVMDGKSHWVITRRDHIKPYCDLKTDNRLLREQVSRLEMKLQRAITTIAKLKSRI